MGKKREREERDPDAMDESSDDEVCLASPLLLSRSNLHATPGTPGAR